MAHMRPGAAYWLTGIAAITVIGATGAGRLPAPARRSPSRPQQSPQRPPMVAGELVVRLRSDFPACAHCLLAKGAGLKSATGSSILDQVRLKHGVAAMEPVFGGVHAAERRKAAQQRFGAKAASGGAAAAPDLSQIYLVRVNAKTDVLKLAADFRRDPNVVSAEPNYLYHAAQSPVAGSQSPAQPPLPRPLGEGGGEGISEETLSLPNDPFLSSSGSWGQDFPDLWGLFQIHAPEAWELSQGEGVIVAVVDTGIDIEHSDLAANVWHNTAETPGNGIDDDDNGFVDDVNGWDFTTCKTAYSDGVCIETKAPSAEVSDPNGHGTHVAGTIAAVGDNSMGIIGVAPHAQVMAVKGFNAGGQGRNADLAAAIVYAAESGAKVINASWAGAQSDTLQMAIDYVTQTFDVVVVAAAGNGGVPLEQGIYPASLPNVTAVGATTHTDEHAAFSNFGGPLDLVAPGGGDSEPAAVSEPQRSILSLLAKGAKTVDQWGAVCRYECHCADPACCADPECDREVCNNVCDVAPWVLAGDYIRAAGTSIAAPHVSGVAALVRSRHPEFTQQQVRQVLRNTADDLGPPGWDLNFGYGRVNAAQAVAIDGIPVAEILLPENRGKIWERDFPFTVTATAAAPGGTVTAWRLTLRPEDGGNAVAIAQGTQPVTDGPLGTLRLDSGQGLEPGRRYVLQLDVTDSDGSTGTDTRVFLIPNPQFAAIPVPDPYDEGGSDGSLSADSTRLVIERIDRDRVRDSLWLFDSKSWKFERIGASSQGRLSPDGKFLLYADTTNFVYWRYVLKNLDGGESRTVPISTLFAAVPAPIMLGTDAARAAFLSQGNLDPTVDNSDGSIEVFLFELPGGPARQVTNGPHLSYAAEIQDDLVMTPDGKHLAFSAQTDLDPTASTGGAFHYQLFVYNDETTELRQISGRSPESVQGGVRPSLNADGTKVAFANDGIYLADLNSGVIDQILDSSGSPDVPLLSADGSKLAFVAALDLDPSITNEDLSPEVFLMDLNTHEVTQVTDTANFPYVRYGTLMDAAGATFLTASGELDGLGLHPGMVRFVRRQHGSRPPTLNAPTSIVVAEGKTAQVALRAHDPDGDHITFHVELDPFGDPQLGQLTRSFLNDHGDGTADLQLAPCFGTAGQYHLRIAAFDSAGELAVQGAALDIEDSLRQDVNQDGEVDSADVALLVERIFNQQPVTYASGKCEANDLNNDGDISAADLVAWFIR